MLLTRMSIRRLLLLVSLAAVPLAVLAWTRRTTTMNDFFLMKSIAFHASAQNMEDFANFQDQGWFRAPGGGEGDPRPSSQLLRRRARYYRDLAAKYKEASKNPSRRHDPDPPLPE